MIHLILTLIIALSSSLVTAQPRVNVYAWGGEIPTSLIQQFEKETGIEVHFSTYDSNETLYAKLRSSKQPLYDVIMPSAYFVERMKTQGMLMRLEEKKLPNVANIDPSFNHSDYDLGNHYSAPLIWGMTGIFYNESQAQEKITSWNDLWKTSWKNQLMLPDDSREVFSLSLMSLGYSPNDNHPAHIKAAYEKLLRLVPNIKLFGSDGVQATMIDEEVMAGVAWNGDAFKAHTENQHIHFVYPSEGFVIWVDCLAIPKNAPHPNEAHQFIDYLLRPTSGTHIALYEGHAITNREGIKRLPERIRNNPMIYPSQATLKRGYIQRSLDEETLALYNQYWQSLKLAF